MTASLRAWGALAKFSLRTNGIGPARLRISHLAPQFHRVGPEFAREKAQKFYWKSLLEACSCPKFWANPVNFTFCTSMCFVQ
jgi:hypothetical protein